MRRHTLVFAALVLALLASMTGAAAAAPTTKVVDGAAHKAGDRVQGRLVVLNTGNRRSARTGGHITIDSGRDRRILARWAAPSLRPGERDRVRFAARVPARLDNGEWRINACTAGQCLRVGHFTEVAGSGSGAGSGGSGSGSGSAKSGPTGRPPPPLPGAPLDESSAPPPLSTFPTDPIPYEAGQPFEVDDPGARYWGFVPETYDASNRTAAPLLIWLHGCGGYSEGDIWVVDPGEEAEPPQDWLTVAVGGREGGCWVPSPDEAKVTAALADFETHFNVDRRRVILGGYSSGGDLAYRTGFRHSSTFAGLLIENSSPFRDTESSQAESLAAATTKLHIVHLAHLQDTTYPIAGVRAETAAVAAAGFPIQRIEVAGEHWNDAGDRVAGHAVPGTDADLRDLLLPHIDDGWQAPAP
jgi:hypothetical protein